MNSVPLALPTLIKAPLSPSPTGPGALHAALGYGGVHVIRSPSRFSVKASRHRNSAGGEKWLDVRRWRSTADCLAAARAAGYQVVATHLNEGALDVRAVDWTRPTAVVLGNEAEGGAGDFRLCVLGLSVVEGGLGACGGPRM